MALISVLHMAHADTLVAENIIVGGSIEVSSYLKTGKTAVLPLTIANILYLLGVSGAASDMRYYYDSTERGYVIAPKTDASTGSGTPAVILLTIIPSGVLGTNYLYWYPNNYSYADALSVTGFGNNLSGTALQNSTSPRATTTTTTRFIMLGTTPNGSQTVVSGYVVESFPAH